MDKQTLRQLRKSKFMSQEDLAERSGIARRTISRIENGKENPSAHTIMSLAKALHVNPRRISFSPNIKYVPAKVPDQKVIRLAHSNETGNETGYETGYDNGYNTALWEFNDKNPNGLFTLEKL